MKKVFRSRVMAVVAGALTMGVVATGGAVAVGEITSADIQNGTIKLKDMRPGVRSAIVSVEGLQERVSGLENRVDNLSDRVARLEDGSGRPVADWNGNDGGQIVDASNIRLVKTDTNSPVVRTSNLDWAVRAGQQIRFTVDLVSGARCSVGADPGLTIVIGTQEYMYNCDNANGGPVVGTIQEGGRITAARFRYAGPSGTVNISGFTINGEAVAFE